MWTIRQKINLAGQTNDAVLEQPGVDVVSALTATRVFHHDGHKTGHGPMPQPMQHHTAQCKHASRYSWSSNRNCNRMHHNIIWARNSTNGLPPFSHIWFAWVHKSFTRLCICSGTPWGLLNIDNNGYMSMSISSVLSEGVCR